MGSPGTSRKGETLGLVGESGCGKSVSALSILRLIPRPPGRIVDGEIIFEGEDLLNVSDAEMRSIRGNRIAMIFQEPMTSLNPVLTIGNQLTEAITLHLGLEKSESRTPAPPSCLSWSASRRRRTASTTTRTSSRAGCASA